MVVQLAELDGTEIIYIWLSKKEREDPVITDIINDIKKKRRVCTFLSGSNPTKDYIRKMLLENIQMKE